MLSVVPGAEIRSFSAPTQRKPLDELKPDPSGSERSERTGSAASPDYPGSCTKISRLSLERPMSTWRS
jgi:hypothetical protein